MNRIATKAAKHRVRTLFPRVPVRTGTHGQCLDMSGHRSQWTDESPKFAKSGRGLKCAKVAPTPYLRLASTPGCPSIHIFSHEPLALVSRRGSCTRLEFEETFFLSPSYVLEEWRRMFHREESTGRGSAMWRQNAWIEDVRDNHIRGSSRMT